MIFVPTSSTNDASNSSSSSCKNAKLSSCTSRCSNSKMASHSMILFFCCVTLYDAIMSFQYGRCMRQLLLSVYPPIDEPYSVTKYQPILINTQLESPALYGNRIGSPANQFYYYDSSKGDNRNKTGDSSAAAMVHGKKMNDEVDEEEDIVVLLSDAENETNTAAEILGDPSDESGDDAKLNKVTEVRS